MAALLLTSMVWSGHAQEKNEMDLSGEWAFQTDVMDFRRGSLDKSISFFSWACPRKE